MLTKKKKRLISFPQVFFRLFFIFFPSNYFIIIILPLSLPEFCLQTKLELLSGFRLEIDSAEEKYRYRIAIELERLNEGMEKWQKNCIGPPSIPSIACE